MFKFAFQDAHVSQNKKLFPNFIIEENNYSIKVKKGFAFNNLKVGYWKLHYVKDGQCIISEGQASVIMWLVLVVKSWF